MESMYQFISNLPVVTLSTLGLVLFYVVWNVGSSYWKLSDFPGPFWARFTDFQRFFWVKTMKAQYIHWDLHQKYGDYVRFGPNTVSLADPAAIPALYPMRAGFPKVITMMSTEMKP